MIHFRRLKTSDKREYRAVDMVPHWNVYDPKLNNKDLTNKFRFFQFAVKYKLVVPFLILMEKTLDKFNMREVPAYHYNQNLQIFDKAYNQSMEQWVDLYLGCKGNPEAIKDRKEGYSWRMLKDARDVVIAGALMDTAYREFLNLLMFNIGQMMYDEYKGKTVKHLFYTGVNCYNVNYYVISKLFYDQNKAEIALKNLSIEGTANASQTDNQQSKSGTSGTNTSQV
jgi:hypothetical protein